jgi:hypothetical protein
MIPDGPASYSQIQRGVHSRPGYQRAFVEPNVFFRVENDKRTVFQNRMRTKRNIARRFIDLQPYLGFEPLSFTIENGNENSWRAKCFPNQGRQLIKGGLRLGIQNAVFF